MKVAIVGTGLQFKRRMSGLDPEKDQLVGVAFFTKSKSKLYPKNQSIYFADWKKCIDESGAEAIIVCTPPHLHKKIVYYALNNNKHVLCEKPMTQLSDDAKYLFQLAKKKKKILKCGFNHRHHPGLKLTKELIKRKSFGKLLFARCVYGINGRKNYFKEWRANKKFSAGGQFIEQGIHLIDLLIWFIGNPIKISLSTSNIVNKKQSLEESGMAVLKFENHVTASIHTSLTQWDNRFNFEIYGENQYVEISGLAGSYGNQKVKLGTKKSKGPFEYKYFDFRSSDVSWSNEWKHFKSAIKGKTKLIGNGHDAYKAMRVAEHAYKSEINLKKIKY